MNLITFMNHCHTLQVAVPSPPLVGRVLLHVGYHRRLHVGYHRLKLTPVLNTEMQGFIYFFISLFMLNEQHF